MNLKSNLKEIGLVSICITINEVKNSRLSKIDRQNYGGITCMHALELCELETDTSTYTARCQPMKNHRTTLDPHVRSSLLLFVILQDCLKKISWVLTSAIRVGNLSCQLSLMQQRSPVAYPDDAERLHLMLEKQQRWRQKFKLNGET